MQEKQAPAEVDDHISSTTVHTRYKQHMPPGEEHMDGALPVLPLGVYWQLQESRCT